MAVPAVSNGSAVQRSLLGNQIADSLRRDILFGRLRPGTRLAQQQLCERFGTSRMPVRDGLRVLLHQGLLTVDSGQHTVVAPMSRSDLLDSFVIEGLLAGIAAGRATLKASEQDFERLLEMHTSMVTSARSQDWSTMADTNWSFHRQINRLAGSRKLLTALRSVALDVPRDYLEHVPGQDKKSNAEHEALLEAMRRRDADQVDGIMSRHIVDSGKNLITFLESQGLSLQ